MDGGKVSHHVSTRKRAVLAGYPHPRWWGRFLDRAVLVAGIAGPLMVIPQIVKIYGMQDASGVSALSWFAFAFFDVPFIVYGLVHRDTPIIVTYILFFIMNITVVIGALLYG
jgi:uncharacterized protein with PQ loop repeat